MTHTPAGTNVSQAYLAELHAQRLNTNLFGCPSSLTLARSILMRINDSDAIPPSLQTITVEQLSEILGRSPKSISVDVTRNPDSLPPVLRVPGSRKIRFRLADVLRWMDELSEVAWMRNQASRQARKRDHLRHFRR